jgi:hypothetical protein
MCDAILEWCDIQTVQYGGSERCVAEYSGSVGC